MYKIDIGRGALRFTKYFLSYNEALSYVRGLGWSKRRIKPVH
ncbi:hypothetical protein [Pseudomonas sp. USHLN015]